MRLPIRHEQEGIAWPSFSADVIPNNTGGDLPEFDVT